MTLIKKKTEKKTYYSDLTKIGNGKGNHRANRLNITST